MKLCYIADANSIHTRRWLAPFVERGDQVSLLSYTRVLRPLEGVEWVDLTQITSVPKIRFIVWGWWVWRYVRKKRPDILHAHQLQGAGWLGVMANYHPFVLSGWGSDILIEPHKSFFRRFFVKRVLQKCDMLVVPSQLMYHESKSLGVQEEKLNLIPWGIETELFQPVPNDCILTRRKFGIDQNSKVVLSPRGVANIYNVDIIVEAINKIVSYFPKVYLVLLNYNTSAEYISKLEEMIASYNLQKHILWLPPQKIADMPQLYRMADVMVSIPSSEGFGFTVYEAMASGCPTIISDLPVFEGELESGTHTIKVPVRSVDHTSWALSNLLTHETLRLNIRQNALEICQTKDAATRVERTKILYQTVIAKFQK